MGITIRKIKKNDLDTIVQIHIKAFQGFFLTLLGKKFLYSLYKNFILDDLSICILVEQKAKIKGFVIGTLKPKSLFKKMLTHQGHLFFIYSLKALIKNPVLVIKKLIYAIRYRGDCPDGYKNAALLSSLGVDPEERTKGIGSVLIKIFCEEAFLKGSDVVYLITDKIKNDRVNSFYLKNGFQLESVIEKVKGRKMNRYIKLPDEKHS